MDYSRTDLAFESVPEHLKSGTIDGIKVKTLNFCSFDVIETKISNALAEKITKRKIGRYFTVISGCVYKYEQQIKNSLSKAISHIISSLIPKSAKNVLICGLGNKSITADSLGPSTIESIRQRPLISSVFILSPGVEAQTGIESSLYIYQISKLVNADVIIAVDSLASRGIDRLCTTIQISDSGIYPGSGIGRAFKEISQNTMDIPVISVGVPTVIEVSSLLFDYFEKTSLKPEKLIAEGEGFFVSPKDSDIIISEYASLIADGIYKALSDR